MSRYIAIFGPDPDRLLSLARTFSPRIEVCSFGGVIVEVPDRYEQSILDRLLQENMALGKVDFATASSRNVAMLAAYVRPGYQVPTGRERDFLSSLPLDALSLLPGAEVDREMLETLSRWGLQNLGQLASLSETELTARLGRRGLQLQRLARGEDLQPFNAHFDPPRFEETRELDWELDGLEPLAFVLKEMFERLCLKLGERGVAADCVHITLQLREGEPYERSVKLAFPMSNPKVLLSLLRLKLQSDPPACEIVGITLRVDPARPQVFQYSLLEPDAPNPEKLSRTIARLSALLGEEGVGSAIVEDTHRPDAFRFVPFSIPENGKERKRRVRNSNGDSGESRLFLRRIRPPLATEIHFDRIVACSGPWHSSGDWWSSGESREEVVSWERDEWDIETAEGQICRVYWDRRQKQWFLEGIYD